MAACSNCHSSAAVTRRADDPAPRRPQRVPPNLITEIGSDAGNGIAVDYPVESALVSK